MSPEDAEEYTQSLGMITTGVWRQIAWAQRQGVPDAMGLTTEQWVRTHLGGYQRLPIEERREAVQELTAPEDEGGMGLSQRKAGEVLGVGKGTVQRDLDGPNGPANPPDQPTNRATGPNGPAVEEVPVFAQVDKHLRAARLALTKALAAIGTLEPDEIEVLAGELETVRDLGNLVSLKLDGVTDINWDAELERLSGEG